MDLIFRDMRLAASKGLEPDVSGQKFGSTAKLGELLGYSKVLLRR